MVIVKRFIISNTLEVNKRAICMLIASYNIENSAQMSMKLHLIFVKRPGIVGRYNMFHSLTPMLYWRSLWSTAIIGATAKSVCFYLSFLFHLLNHTYALKLHNDTKRVQLREHPLIRACLAH